mgnify:CR=1 FL=1
MYTITVAPVRRGFGVDGLTYYHAHPLPLGSVVSIPLKKQTVLGVVIRSRSVTDAKAVLRNADFALKKITASHGDALFSEQFMAAVETVAHEHATTLGATLAALTPSTLLHAFATPPITYTPPNLYELQGIQDTRTNRYDYYRQVIRTALANNRSVLLVAPTYADINHLEQSLSRGISSRVIAIHGGLTKKKQIAAWNTIRESNDALVVIATLQFACVHRSDYAAFILEKEAGAAHGTHGRPYVHARTIIPRIAEAYGVPCIIGDTLLTTTTRYHLEAHPAIHEPHRIRTRHDSSATTSIVPMQNYRDQPLSDEALTLLTTRDHAAVFVSRRGMYPHTICGDCGTTVTCTNCDTPVVVHGTTPETRVFMCHRCHRRRSAKEYCSECSSWKLVPLGIGSTTVSEYLKKAFPDRTIIQIDSDTTTTHRQVERAMEQFATTPGAIVVGTEMMLPYLTTVPHTIVASLDSMYALPDYRTYERIARILLILREITTAHLIHQTRVPNTLAEYALDGTLAPLYTEEITARQQLNFPPLTVQIKCTAIGSESAVEKATIIIEELFASHHPITYPAFRSRVKNNYVVHTLFSVPRDAWPDDDVIERLRALPPQIQIRVHPESTL